MNGSATPATGTSNTAETAGLSGLTPDTDLLVQHRGRQQRRHDFRHGDQLHDLGGGAKAVTNAATSVSGTSATLNGSANAEGASTAVTYCYSTSSPSSCLGGSHHRERIHHPAGGLRHYRDGRAQQPDAEHRVLLPDQSGQQRRHHLR